MTFYVLSFNDQWSGERLSVAFAHILLCWKFRIQCMFLKGSGIFEHLKWDEGGR